MTPKREAYLANCSRKELNLRAFIADSKVDIKHFKRDLKIGRFHSRNINLILIRHEKIKLNAYRHELARFKGMDRVVFIGDDEPHINTLTGADYWVCKCGSGIYKTDNYCTNCGRKILWGD